MIKGLAYLPLFSGLISFALSMHERNFACACFNCANELVRCESSCGSVLVWPLAVNIRMLTTCLFELLFHFSELRKLKICDIDLLGSGCCTWRGHENKTETSAYAPISLSHLPLFVHFRSYQLVQRNSRRRWRRAQQRPHHRI